MKNLNLFRKSARGSEGSTLASAVVRPSFDRRLTVVKHLAFMLLFLLGSLNVWGADVIDNAATSAKCSGTATNTWVSDFSISGASGAEYRIHTMGTKNTSNALQWNKNGFLTQTKTGGTLKSITIKGTSGKSIDVYAANSAYSTSAPSGTAVATLSLTGNDATYTFTSDYTYFALKGKESSTQIVSITIEYKSGGGSTPSISLDPSSLDLAATGNAQQNIELTATNFSGSVNSVECAFFSAATCQPSEATAQPEWITSLSDNNSNQVSFNVADNNEGARNIWMKITASDGTGNASAVLAIAQAKYIGPASLPFAYDGNGTGDLPNGLEVSGTGTYGSSPAIKFDGTGDNVIVHFNAAPGTLTYDIKGNSFSGGTFTVQESEDGTDYTEVASYTSLSDVQNEEYDLNSASRYVKFIYTNKSSGNVALGNIAISEYVAPAAVAKPTISGETPFLTTTEVTLTQAEADAIYYTTDGSDPKTSGDKLTYSAPFTINADGTTMVKAYAVKGSDESDVAEKAFTKITPLTIANVLSGIEETEGDAFLLNDVTVTYAYGNNVYVKDATGSIMIYSAITGAANGKVLQGLQGKAKLYNGLPEVSTVTKAPTVIDGTAVEPIELNTYPTDADLNKYVTLEDVTFASAATLSGSVTNIDGTFKETTLILRNQFKLNGVSVVTGKSYRVVGVVQKYNETYQVYPITITEIVEAGAPEAPTFSVAAGTYTSVQSVELSCATEGATIYYTTDGATPTTESTVYSSAIEVGADMTIKAIAIKDTKSSSVAEAAYVINLPEDESVRKTWDLSTDSYVSDPEPTADLIQWTATYVSMKNERTGTETAVNNYIPTAKTSTRFYSGNKLTITPSGKSLTTIVFTATSEGYATALANSTWTNATAVADGTTVTVTATDGDAAVSAVIGATCGFTAVQVNYINIDLTKPATPTFSVAAGTYTSVQSVELSCVTEGATIYYTTDGATPTIESTVYSSAIEVGADMTIKAIAIKDTKSSSVAEAAYVINLPEDENIRKTWDLSTDSYVSDPEPTADLIQWTATYVSMKNERTGTETAVNNYIPTAKTSTRFYSGNKLTITPSGKQISTIVFTATSESYATALAGSTWTNATAEATGSVVTVTAAGPGAVVAAVGGTCGFTAVQVNYGPIDSSIPEAPTFSVAAGTYTSVQSVELSCATEGATIYYTTDGATPTIESTVYSSAIEVGADMTIKAIAIKDTKSSSVAEAAYVINLPIILTTMDAIFAKATEFGNTLTEVQITFDNWVVSGISTDDKNIYVTDGTKGLVIYDKDALKGGFEVNDKLNGTVTCNLKLYRGFSDIDGLKANATGLTVTHDGEVTPITANIADLGAINTGAPIVLSNVMYNGSVLTDGANTITPYNTFYADAVSSLEENKYYNITGIYVHFNTTKEVAPRSAADIVELTQKAPTMTWYTSDAKEATIEANATYTIDLGDAFAPVFETNSTGALTYSSSDPTIAEINETTGALTLKGVTGTTFIKCAVAAAGDYTAGEQGFTLRVREAVAGENVVIVALYDGKWYAMKNTFTSVKVAASMEVTYADGKIWDLPTADQEAITWVRTVDGDNVTFQAPNGDYLKTSGSDLALEAGESGNYQWNWNSTYYRTGEQTRTFVYRDGYNFRSYAVSNAGQSGYSALPVVTAAVFATTPVEPVYETVRSGLEINRHYTVCLPKNITHIKGATFWNLQYKNVGNTEVYLVEETAPAAGKPYIIQATDTKLEVVYGEEIAADPVENGALRGTFTGINETDFAALEGTVYLLISNAIRPRTAGNYLDANRAYVRYDKLTVGTPASIPGRRVKSMPMAPQVATGVENVQGDNVQCTKVLINGQLYIMYNGTMYNVQGQLVK